MHEMALQFLGEKTPLEINLVQIIPFDIIPPLITQTGIAVKVNCKGGKKDIFFLPSPILAAQIHTIVQASEHTNNKAKIESLKKRMTYATVTMPL